MLDGDSIIEDVSLFVRHKNIDVEELYVERGHLDQVFRELTNAQYFWRGVRGNEQQRVITKRELSAYFRRRWHTCL